MKYIIVMRRDEDDWKVAKLFWEKKEVEEIISDQLKRSNEHGFATRWMIAKIVRRVEKDKSYFILVRRKYWYLIHMDIYPHNDTYQWSSVEAQKEIEKLRNSGGTFMIAEPVNFNVQVKISK